MDSETSVIVLQGGGALGAYQGGAVEALSDAGHPIDWVAGISIGAINSALVAGNAPGNRTTALRNFWEMVSSSAVPVGFFDGVLSRGWLNDMSAAGTTITGVPGFFKLRFPPAGMLPRGSVGARSFYDTSPLRETLLEFVDFDRLNNGPVRLSVGAVNIETGNMTWFDSAEMEIRPEHIMASGALPPGFPAIEIDGAYYWDGGLVSNTPLQYVLDEQMPADDLCVFQVDLFSARGAVPTSVWTSEAREKDIRFSSRTRFNTDMMRRMHQTRDAARRLYDKLPLELKDDPDAKALASGNADPRVTIAHLIYRQTKYEHQSKDYEFSRRSMLDHWAAGRKDVERTLSHPDWRARHDSPERVNVFDLSA
ncbi:NTE family protein [Aliiroseovarius sediminilitoris]|uniref:NTE family protein n=1 Tax=Aliiroseovarius sediminilitoris TaxID=1173584 RepID=A0A1I0QF77_9RHOB|nr:patatin-like phospholipase family protein [Aliiroseovarius sediminilitoris]SEW25615.1 NTE family protein [Aliiroseovarius sediminilitoris]